MSLTPLQRRECIEALEWSQNELADILGLDRRAVRRWFVPDDPRCLPVPEAVDNWLVRKTELWKILCETKPWKDFDGEPLPDLTGPGDIYELFARAEEAE